MSAATGQFQHISVKDFLTGERQSEVKHEYVAGQVFAMAGASIRHNLLGGNMYGLLWSHLQQSPCFPLTNDMLVKTAEDRYRYPDVQVVCEDGSSTDDYVREQPILIIEVLSRSTRRRDKTEKRAEYLALPSLLEYVLIEQEFAEIEIQRRSNGWQSEYYYLGQSFKLESVELDVSVEAVYQRVDNEDVRAYLKTLTPQPLLPEGEGE